MAQGRFRVGITRDNLRPSGKPIFDESALKILEQAGIEYEFLAENEAELKPETAAKYDALAVMLAIVLLAASAIYIRMIERSRNWM